MFNTFSLHTRKDLQVANSHAVHGDARAAEGTFECNRGRARTGGITVRPSDYR